MQDFVLVICGCGSIEHPLANFLDTRLGMTPIQNGSYFWLKMNYRMYLCCLEFLSVLTIPAFFLGASASEESNKVAKIVFSMSQIEMRCRSLLSRFFFIFQSSRNDQVNFLSFNIPLAWLTNVSKVVNQNHRPQIVCLLSVSLALS